MSRIIVMTLILLAVSRSTAFAWGCEGHQAIAMLAATLLDPGTVNAIKVVLTASPVDPTLKRFCQPVAPDPIVDASTWADDEREVQPATAGWHFIDFPRAVGANTANYKPFCPASDCVIDAIVKQFNALKAATDRTVKANALRFLIHFIGDIHQPLHAISNGDRGGNCVPVTYLSQPPVEGTNESFSPNLHRVWDTDLIRTMMSAHGLADAGALAHHLGAGLPHGVTAEAPTESRVNGWARGANSLARTVTYGRLRTSPPMEPASAALNLATCAGNNHVSQRMAMLNETIDQAYVQASEPVITGQLRLAGQRLAAALKAAFPEGASASGAAATAGRWWPLCSSAVDDEDGRDAGRETTALRPEYGQSISRRTKSW